MAVQAAVANRDVTPDGAVVLVTWSNLANADSGNPVQYAAWADKSFQVSGTFGAGGNALMEGSNDGVTWASLSNRQGTAMNFTAAGINTSQDHPVWVRPRITAGDGTTLLVVSVACHRSDLPVGSVG